jgi:hypothetical protein
MPLERVASGMLEVVVLAQPPRVGVADLERPVSAAAVEASLAAVETERAEAERPAAAGLAEARRSARASASI